MTKYQMYGLNLSEGQIKKIALAAKAHREVKIRLSKNNLQGDHKLPLTQRQINKIKKSKTGIDLDTIRLTASTLGKKWRIYSIISIIASDIWWLRSSRRISWRNR